MCDCNERVDGLLKERGSNTVLNLPMFVGDGPARVFVETMKRDEKKRGKPEKMFANFCPFCGEKYASASPVILHDNRQED